MNKRKIAWENLQEINRDHDYERATRDNDSDSDAIMASLRLNDDNYTFQAEKDSYLAFLGSLYLYWFA